MTRYWNKTTLTPFLGILSLLFFMVVVANVSTANVAEETWMPDAKLRAQVRAKLGLKSDDPLTQEAMTQLKFLKSNKKRISDLTGLEYATELKELHLKNNRISDITPLRELTALKKLDLRSSKISDLTPLSRLTALTHLFFEGNRISDITSLSGLTALTRLDLRSNKISDLTPLSRLTALTHLFLWGNPISDFAPLRSLLTENPNMRIVLDIDIPPPNRAPLPVRTIPAAYLVVDGAAAVVDVSAYFHDLDRDRLTYSATSNDEDVATVTMSGVQATITPVNAGNTTITITASDGTLTATQSITVSVVASVGADWIGDRTPRVRDAIIRAAGVNSANEVTEAHLAAITSLSLQNSYAKALKAGDFNGLTALTTLNLSNMDNLRSLPANIFDDLTQLTTLYLYNNRLRSLPANIFDNLTELTTLQLYGNRLRSLPANVFDNLTKLEELDLYENHLRSLPANVFDNLTKLKYLDLNRNRLSSLPANVFDNLPELTSLRLDYNRLSSLPANIFGNRLPELTSLLLSDNSLSSLPDNIFDNLPKLGQLQLDGNSLSSLPDNIFDNFAGSLWYLQLKGNDISDVSELEGLANLRYLYISGNPIADYGPIHRLKAKNPGLAIDVYTHNTPPVFTEGSSTTRTVPENTATGQNIGTPISAEDHEHHPLFFSLGGTDADAFSIVRRTGQLQTKTALDYETKSSYTVEVAVSDINGAADRITVTINVTDVDEIADAPPTQPLPSQTALFANYPNPFNPETWVPYQLSKPADVTLKIYDAKGVVVRELKLGHQDTGVYHSRNRAIHWDGKNAVGEPAVSGVYFYTLTAGDFTATRKLLILK